MGQGEGTTGSTAGTGPKGRGDGIFGQGGERRCGGERCPQVGGGEGRNGGAGVRRDRVDGGEANRALNCCWGGETAPAPPGRYSTWGMGQERRYGRGTEVRTGCEGGNTGYGSTETELTSGKQRYERVSEADGRHSEGRRRVQGDATDP